MSQTRALFWKEWYEVRTFFVIAIFVFLGLPLIGAAEDVIARQRFDLSASIWVFLLGGVFAVFVGVGTVVRDLNGRLEEFWRSRPVSVPRWLVVKYLTGLSVMLFTLMVPVIAELAVNRKHEFGVDPRLILAWSPFFWAAAYSMAFAIACVVRRGAHAAMLSIALLLLMYFLPQVLPPLRFLSLSWVMDESQIPEVDHSGHALPAYHRLPWLPWPVLYRPRQLAFVAGMIALCAIGLTIAILAVRRDWRVESGRKTMYWSIGGALLILFSSAAFQVGSNLAVLQTVELPRITWIQSIRGTGVSGITLCERWEGGNQPGYQPGHSVIRTFKIKDSDVELGPEAEVDIHFNWYGLLGNPEHPEVFYVPGEKETAKESGLTYPILTTVVMNGARAATATQSFPELIASNKLWDRQWWSVDALAWHDRLYVLGWKLMTFDISRPNKPRLLSAEALNWQQYSRNPQAWRFLRSETDDMTSVTLPLPPIPKLPARQRLELAVKTFDGAGVLSGDVLVGLFRDHIVTYRLEQLSDTSVTFRRLGRYDPTALHRLIGSSSWRNTGDNGLLFEVLANGPLGGEHIEVFDVTGSRPRSIGHFAFPHENQLLALYGLPDGRLLVAGQSRLYLLGAPPGWHQ